MDGIGYQKIFACFWMYIGFVLIWSVFKPLSDELVILTFFISLMAGTYWHYLLTSLKMKLKNKNKPLEESE